MPGKVDSTRRVSLVPGTTLLCINGARDKDKTFQRKGVVLVFSLGDTIYYLLTHYYSQTRFSLFILTMKRATSRYHFVLILVLLTDEFRFNKLRFNRQKSKILADVSNKFVGKTTSNKSLMTDFPTHDIF